MTDTAIRYATYAAGIPDACPRRARNPVLRAVKDGRLTLSFDEFRAELHSHEGGAIGLLVGMGPTFIDILRQHVARPIVLLIECVQPGVSVEGAWWAADQRV